MNRKPGDIFKLIISIVVCELAGVIGSIFTISAIPTWYAALQKPSFTPPNWLFAPAWGTLYLLMGIAAFVIWRKGLDDKRVKAALIVFLIQLILNALWSIVFFRLESPLFGVIVIVILWIVILFTILKFFRISTLAGGLLLPYIGWVTFAAALNVSVFILNS
ncbi:MAG: TspO protein [Syntrophaceae bacterium CG2_30_49_12]|nr:MAG: TspO protein [Syntrophaceae bacterium CG2_30_49_12]PIX27240.1 MAG: TspO protein [Chloroflexi bacterium CG_4_8_14_3_um_filter_45_15]